MWFFERIAGEVVQAPLLILVSMIFLFYRLIFLGLNWKSCLSGLTTSIGSFYAIIGLILLMVVRATGNHFEINPEAYEMCAAIVVIASLMIVFFVFIDMCQSAFVAVLRPRH
jgi:hypothetical protein